MVRSEREIMEDLQSILLDLQAKNEPDEPTRSRELSLAITKLEEAKHWLLSAPARP